MSKIIELYGSLILFCGLILILIGVVGIGVSYLSVNNVALTLIEEVEVNEGVNDYVSIKLATIKEEFPHLIIEIEEQELDTNFLKYTIDVHTNLMVPIINLKIPLKSSKSTKRIRI